MALLEISDLTISIKNSGKNTEIVKNIGFSIQAGEIIALAGESGGGKTLTGLAIPHLLPAIAQIDKGTILFNSLELDSCPEKEFADIRGKKIGMIFQEPKHCLNPLIRIGIQIAEALMIHGEKSKKNIRDKSIKMLELTGFRDPLLILKSYPHQLSAGMCQRVMTVIAAICEPMLLIADEPVNSLDPKNQELVLKFLKQINRDSGTAILFITHDLHILKNFSNSLLIMQNGKIVEQGPAETVFSKPAHAYTKALLQAIPEKIPRTAYV
jgi:ABC-type dipeptide/oligopeptide/nickel transport system ATPase component